MADLVLSHLACQERISWRRAQLLTWKEILREVSLGYEGALGLDLRGSKPKFTRNQIRQIIERLDGQEYGLKQAVADNELKNFFKTNMLPEDTVDEVAEKSKGLQSILINDFEPSCLRPANYDLRLGDEVYVTAEKLPRRLTTAKDTVAIQPGEFGILMTHEYLHVPTNYLGLISLRFSFKKQGLVNISGFHVDPGFTGKIIFSVFNTGPRSVVLRFKEPVFMIMFEKLSQPATAYSGAFAQLRHIPVDIITSLGGQSVSVLSLDNRVRNLETQLRILEALGVGSAVVILSYIIGKLLHLI